MSSGCVPNEEDRLQAFIKYRQAVADALGILVLIEHPDDDPRGVETAVGRLSDVQGKRAQWYIDNEEEFGITDLMEHYFS
jgi:hypothetical protein